MDGKLYKNITIRRQNIIKCEVKITSRFLTQKLPIFFRIRGADCTFNSCYTATTDVGEVAKPLILLGLQLISSQRLLPELLQGVQSEHGRVSKKHS